MNLRQITLSFVLLSQTLATQSDAASIVIDTFDDGEFSLSNSNSWTVSNVQRGGMLGGQRQVGIDTSRRITVVTSELIAGTSYLSFDTGDGAGLGIDAGTILLQWFPYPSLSLLGCDAFVVNFSNLVGLGEFRININERSVFGSSIPLSGPGEIRIPMSQVNVGRGTLAGVWSIEMEIYGGTTDFALRIDEFKVVPEPSSSMLLFCGLAKLFSRRKAGLRARDCEAGA